MKVTTDSKLNDAMNSIITLPIFRLMAETENLSSWHFKVLIHLVKNLQIREGWLDDSILSTLESKKTIEYLNAKEDIKNYLSTYEKYGISNYEKKNLKMYQDSGGVTENHVYLRSILKTENDSRYYYDLNEYNEILSKYRLYFFTKLKN